MIRRTAFAVVVLAAAAGVAAGAHFLLKEEPREVTTSSREAYACYKDGLTNVRRFRLEDALNCFQKAVEIDPDFAIGHLRVATMARELGQEERFKAALKAAYERRDQVSEIERLQIERTHALVNEDHERGRELYEQMLAKFPDHPTTLRLRAEFAKMNEDFETALRCYDRILEADPEAIDIHNLKGYLFLQEGRYEDAVQSLQRYAFYAPDQANPHDSLGEAYLALGRYEDAIREFVKSLDIDPAFAWSAKNLALALAITGQVERAHEVLDKTWPVFEQRNWESWFHAERVRVDLVSERWEPLLEVTSPLLPWDATQMRGTKSGITILYGRTVALLELGRLEEARQTRDELVKLFEAVVEEGSYYRQMEPIVDLNSALLASHFARAEGDPAKMVEELQRAIEASRMGPHDLAEYRQELVQALMDGERFEEASAQADVLLGVVPTHPKLNLLAAECHVHLDQRDDAIEHLRTYLDVMRYADDDLADVLAATQMLQRLVPRS
jgi:tetratricopeptide (TPR) repeat protein